MSLYWGNISDWKLFMSRNTSDWKVFIKWNIADWKRFLGRNISDWKLFKPEYIKLKPFSYFYIEIRLWGTGMKEHEDFFCSCSVLAPGTLNSFCSYSVLIPRFKFFWPEYNPDDLLTKSRRSFIFWVRVNAFVLWSGLYRKIVCTFRIVWFVSKIVWIVSRSSGF